MFRPIFVVVVVFLAAYNSYQFWPPSTWAASQGELINDSLLIIIGLLALIVLKEK